MMYLFILFTSLAMQHQAANAFFRHIDMSSCHQALHSALSTLTLITYVRIVYLVIKFYRSLNHPLSKFLT
jgi:hypothetical protein